MKSYTKEYLNKLGLDETDFCACECCFAQSTEIHHIRARSKYKQGLNQIENIMAICRSCHQKYGDKKHYMVYLNETHRRFLSDNGVRFDSEYFNEMISQNSL